MGELERLAGGVLERLGELSLQGGALVLLALALALAARRLPAEARHLVWLIVVLRLAAPVDLSTPVGVAGRTAAPRSLPSLAPIAEPATSAALDRTGSRRSSRALVPAPRAVEPGSPAIPWRTGLLALWSAGALVLLGVVVAQMARGRRRLALAAPADRALRREVEALCRRLGVRTPNVRVTDGRSSLASPALFGLRRPTLALPESIVRRWTADEREPLIVHELVHLRRRDLWIHWLQLAVQAVFWFHPLVWLANRRLRVERELACDEGVARIYGEASGRYARALLRIARDPGPRMAVAPAVTLAEPRSLLGARIRRLASGGRVQRRSRLATLGMGVAALALVAVASARSTPALPLPEFVLGEPELDRLVREVADDPERTAALEASWLQMVRSGEGNPVLLQHGLSALRARRPVGWLDALLPARKERRAWLERLRRLPDDPETLRAAAGFLMVEDRDTAELLLLRGWQLDADQSYWPLELARLQRLRSLQAREPAAGARTALTLYEVALPSVDEGRAYYLLGDVARTALAAGEITKARRYAERLLELASRRERDWNYGNALHQGHTVLGLAALAEADRARATEHLRLSAETPGSPQLGSFGPSMRLAADLLAAGERQAVLDYLERCRRFWPRRDAELVAWSETIRSGGDPAFRNLYR